MDNIYINKIIELAQESLKNEEVPVGAIIVKNNKIIASGTNNKEENQSILGHAEVNAILKASTVLNNWNLSDCDLYVTLKPCSMCSEIIKQSRIRNVYYLLDKPSEKKEYYKTNFAKINDNINEKLYSEMMNQFFRILRNK